MDITFGTLLETHSTAQHSTAHTHTHTHTHTHKHTQTHTHTHVYILSANTH